MGAELVPMYEAQAKQRMLAGKKAGNPSPNSGEGKGKATELAARAVNVSKTSIEAAVKVKRDAAPEVLEAAKDRGQIKVSTAAQLATLPKAKQREIAHLRVEFTNAPRGTRAKVEPQSTASVDLSVGYQMGPALP